MTWEKVSLLVFVVVLVVIVWLYILGPPKVT